SGKTVQGIVEDVVDNIAKNGVNGVGEAVDEDLNKPLVDVVVDDAIVIPKRKEKTKKSVDDIAKSFPLPTLPQHFESN
ncbi:hypothetical protein HAX54_052407, partial [Datura stramonium]|nr:hypothetical protein [Datura stramonium]